MYPKEILPGIDMYLIMLAVAAVAAIAIFRLLADNRKVTGRLQNLCLFGAVAAIFLGYYSAVLFQAFYNIPKNNGFVINSSTGATFYGGLIGGAIVFLSIYFIAGRKMFGKGGAHTKEFFTVLDIAAACVVIAHGLGRIGCLFAGCCHGAETDAWYGIYMSSVGKTVVPTQLFEALFLFALFGLFLYRVLKGKTYNLALYMALYGVWRFFLEYARADYRGTTLVSFMTPSQLTAVVMVVGAVALFLVQLYLKKKLPAKNGEAE